MPTIGGVYESHLTPTPHKHPRFTFIFEGEYVPKFDLFWNLSTKVALSTLKPVLGTLCPDEKPYKCIGSKVMSIPVNQA